MLQFVVHNTLCAEPLKLRIEIVPHYDVQNTRHFHCDDDGGLVVRFDSCKCPALFVRQFVLCCFRFTYRVMSDE